MSKDLTTPLETPAVLWASLAGWLNVSDAELYPKMCLPGTEIPVGGERG